MKRSRGKRPALHRATALGTFTLFAVQCITYSTPFGRGAALGLNYSVRSQRVTRGVINLSIYLKVSTHKLEPNGQLVWWSEYLVQALILEGRDDCSVSNGWVKRVTCVKDFMKPAAGCSISKR